MVICLERGADLHMVQLMPLPLTVSCFSKTQTGFTFLVPAHLGSPGKRAVKRMCVCVYVGPPRSRTKTYAARVSYAADDAHRSSLHGFAAAARDAPGTDRRTDEQTDTAPF